MGARLVQVLRPLQIGEGQSYAAGEIVDAKDWPNERIPRLIDQRYIVPVVVIERLEPEPDVDPEPEALDVDNDDTGDEGELEADEPAESEPPPADEPPAETAPEAPSRSRKKGADDGDKTV